MVKIGTRCVCHYESLRSREGGDKSLFRGLRPLLLRGAESDPVLGTGVYVGTYYECKKTLDTIKERVKLVPEKKDK